MSDRMKNADAAAFVRRLGELNTVDQRGRFVGELIEQGIVTHLLRRRIVRPDDLLVLDLLFENLAVQRRKLRRVVAGKPALLIVGHQPQAIAEQAFLKTSSQSSKKDFPDPVDQDGARTPAQHAERNKRSNDGLSLPAAARAAGASRLVFEMPEGLDEIDYTLPAILEACATWPLKLEAAARPAPAAESGASWMQWGELHIETTRVSDLLREAVASTFGAAATQRLQSASASLAREVLASPRRTKNARTAFRSLVQSSIERALPEQAGLPEDQRLLARTFLEMGAAGQVFRELPVDRIWDVGFELWPYLLRPRRPAGNRTSIELPYRLMGSPLQTAGFAHARAPVTRGGRTELWHTRLGSRLPGGEIDDRAVEPLRYLWSPDYEDPQPTGPRMSLDALDRQMIVKLTADYALRAKGSPARRFEPRPVDVRRLMLTALGGTLDLDKAWRERPEKVDVMAWVHRATLGRDYYVRVEYAGYLFPFGHAATLIKLTERKFEKHGADFVAPLRQRYFIVVRDRVRRFGGGRPQSHGGRQLPFQAIECLTEVTPDLDVPGGSPDDRVPEIGYANALEHRMAFWPAHPGSGSSSRPKFRFSFVGVDADGRRVPFTLPAIFLSEERNTATHVPRVRDHYNKEATASRRNAATGGATIRYATPDGTASDVDLPTISILFMAQAGSGSYAYNVPRYAPAFESTRIVVPAIQRLAGVSDAVLAKFDEDYLKHDFGERPAGLFLKIENASRLAFGAAGTDKAGGIAAPDLTPGGLSRRFGVVGGNLAQFKAGKFDPAQFFPEAKLLGFLSLKDLLAPVSLAGDASGAPEFTTRLLPDGKGHETRFHLQQDAKSVGDLFLAGAGGPTTLTLDAKTVAYFDGRTPESRVDGELSHFKINLFGAVVLWFERLRFHGEAGKKPEVDVDLHPRHGVTFGGPLEFVNALKDLIPSNGFSDPPGLSITPQGITASFSLGLPNLQVGVMALSNINLGASFNLPFTGDKPNLRFNFAERHNTFNLTVSLFGGGGFFALCVDTEKLREIEAALEFGASVQIDLGVASGSVYVKAGFYFRLAADAVEFQGYFEMGGRLRIIGLISVSITFHLSLAYERVENGVKADGSPRAISKLYGQAKLTVEVEVLFFSTSVTVKVTREFAGSESDPKFIHFIPQPSVWQRYCRAFA